MTMQSYFYIFRKCMKMFVAISITWWPRNDILRAYSLAFLEAKLDVVGTRIVYIDPLNSLSIDIPLAEFVDVFIDACMYVNWAPRAIRWFGSRMIINQVIKRMQKRYMKLSKPQETLTYMRMEVISSDWSKNDDHEEDKEQEVPTLNLQIVTNRDEEGLRCKSPTWLTSRHLQTRSSRPKSNVTSGDSTFMTQATSIP